MRVQISSLQSQIHSQESDLQSQEEELGRAKADLNRLQQEEAQLEQSLQAGRIQLETIIKSLKATQDEINQVQFTFIIYKFSWTLESLNFFNLDRNLIQSCCAVCLQDWERVHYLMRLLGGDKRQQNFMSLFIMKIHLLMKLQVKNLFCNNFGVYISIPVNCDV